jgi:hypothetical protein
LNDRDGVMGHDDVTQATLMLHVDAESLGAHSAESLVLLRMDPDSGEWVPQETRVVEAGDGGATLEVSLPGFSVFQLAAATQAPDVYFAQEGATLSPSETVVVEVSKGVEIVEISINGEAVEVAFDGTHAAYTPESPMSPGAYTLGVVASGMNGLTTTESFSFHVSQDGSAVPGQDSDADGAAQAAESPVPLVVVLLAIGLIAFVPATRRHR